jgi:PAS domain S-box-containing protein
MPDNAPSTTIMNKMDPHLYKLLFDQNPDAIVIFDITGEIKNANARFFALLELSSEEFDNSSLTALFYDNEAHFISERFKKSVNGEVQRFEATFLNARGKGIVVSVKLFPVKDESEIKGVYCILKDITNSKIEQQKLEQSELNYGRNQKLLNAIVENAEEGIAVTDLEGHFIIYNRAMVELLGVQQTDSKSYDWSNIYNIHDSVTGMIVPKAELPIVRAMKGEYVKDQVFLIKNPVKGDVYLSISSSSIKDAEGNTIASMVIDRDITDQITYERKLNTAISELKQSNLRFKYASQAVSDAIWDLNLVTKSCYWGDGFKSLFGHDANYYTTDTDFWIHFIHPEDRDRVFKSVYEAVNDPNQSKWEDGFRFRKADNTYAVVADRAIIIRDEHGKAFQIIGAMQDITRLKLEEQRLKLLESVITNTSVGVLIADIEIIPGFGPRILYVNEAFTSMTGYEPHDVLNGSPRILYGLHTDPIALNTLWEAMLERRPVEVELKIYTKSKNEFWVHMTVVPVQDSTGTYSHFVSLLRDITDRKIHEFEKEQFIKGLTQRNKELKQFTYITSHNLRSPLVNMMGLLQIIDDIEVHDEDLKAIHEKLKISSESLICTVNDLMDILYTKDNQFIEVEENEVSVVLDHVLKLVGKIVAEIQPEIVCDFKDAPSIKFHKAYFESILMNLLTNAIKYRSPNRKLKIEVATKIQEDRVVMTFRDNGIGFDLERHKDRIFGFYQKFHNHPDSKGLGLFLVKSQMEDLGGTVDMESFPDAGTTLTLSFKQ